MGRGMAASLARAGLSVKQYDREPAALRASAEQAPASIKPVDSLQALCRDTDAVVVSVAGEAAERAVFLSGDGLVAHSPPGALLIGCGTVTVSLAREVHAAAAARGLRYLDAPVSGGPEGAANGTLSIMAGGSADDFAAAAPVFAGMGGYSVRMGGAGAGAAAKLINQLLTATNALAATEALALAQRLGIDTPEAVSQLLALLGKSWGNSTMLQRTGGLVQGALGADGPAEAALAAPAAAPLRNFAKDLDFILQARGPGLGG